MMLVMALIVESSIGDQNSQCARRGTRSVADGPSESREFVTEAGSVVKTSNTY
jgi:hypothetical protein